MNIQWYPGHMTKTKRSIQESISLVDVVIELLDARIPLSSKNPDIDSLSNGKPRIIVMNKSDLADDAVTKKWTEYFESKGFIKVIECNSVSGKGLDSVIIGARELMAEKIARNVKRGRILTVIRAMIVGIPNVGKSTLINKCLGRAMAKTGDKPGVTRSKQWIKIKNDFELLDTPGILWPKFEDKNVGLKLAFTGAVKDEIMDIRTLAQELITLLVKIKPDCLTERYKISFTVNDKSEDILLKIGEARGCKLKGGLIDKERTAAIIIDEFRGGKLGRITLELPMESEV